MASDIEEPSFKVVKNYGAFEVRDYDEHIVARTIVDGGYRASLNRGFQRLAGFIFGGNSQRSEIAMTAPVGAVSAGNQWVVTFSMPQAFTMETLPRPNDQRVQLETVPKQRVAVLTFSGWANAEKMREKEAVLRKHIRERGLTAQGEAMLAQYNPPWTLWFLRRNEIHIPVAI